jgi:hypothetical protein
LFVPLADGDCSGCARSCSLGIVAQVKIMEKHALVFIGLWFVFSSATFRKIQDCVMEEEKV